MTRLILPTLAALAGCLAATAEAADNDTIDVELKAPMLVCHELSGGVRPPAKEGDRQPEHDLIFFVVSGRAPDGSTINEVAPRSGSHLKIDNRRQSMILKNIDLWRGKFQEGQTATLVIEVREQDGKDSAEEDLKEAAQVAQQVDHNKSLAELARIPVHEVLQAGAGENDHIGTIVIQIKNERGRPVIQTERGADSAYLKGYASNHPTERAFKLNGDHSDYDLHLRVGEGR